jgi:hypothetical protein
MRVCELPTCDNEFEPKPHNKIFCSIKCRTKTPRYKETQRKYQESRKGKKTKRNWYLNHYHKNYQRSLENNRRWRQMNPDKAKERDKRYYYQNHEKRKEEARLYQRGKLVFNHGTPAALTFKKFEEETTNEDHGF